MSGTERGSGAELESDTEPVDEMVPVRDAGPELSDRDRKLLLLGALTQQYRIDDAAEQMRAALDAGELTEAQLHEIAIFLCHYAGWPRGTALDMRVGAVVGRWKKAARRAAEAAGAEAVGAEASESVQNRPQPPGEDPPGITSRSRSKTR